MRLIFFKSYFRCQAHPSAATQFVGDLRSRVTTTCLTLQRMNKKDLPARLDVAATAKLLSFAEHDIQILMVVGKLTPLGEPAPNAPKWFAAVEMIRRAADREWLHKATREISRYWRHKRERRKNLKGIHS